MKKVLASLVVITTTALLMTSCKKEVMPAPVENAATPMNEAEAGRIGGSPISVLTKTLTKLDKDSLHYDGSGRLVKVQHSPTRFTTYTYAFNYITSETFADGKTEDKRIYQLNAEGRVTESEEHRYSYPSANVTWHDQKWFKYEYDAEGHLKEKFNKYQPKQRTQFGWGPTGNLASIYFYDENNEMLYRLHFAYVGYANKLKLNPVRSKLDPYLCIFGKGSVSMTSHEIRYQPGTNTPDMSENFTYVLNADGYPTSCTVVNLLTNRRIDQFAYGYKPGQ